MVVGASADGGKGGGGGGVRCGFAARNAAPLRRSSAAPLLRCSTMSKLAFMLLCMLMCSNLVEMLSRKWSTLEGVNATVVSAAS